MIDDSDLETQLHALVRARLPVSVEEARARADSGSHRAPSSIRRSPRRLSLILSVCFAIALAAGVVALVSVTGGTRASPGATTIGPCKDGVLKVTFGTGGQEFATASGQGIVVELVNIGASTCTVDGFPHFFDEIDARELIPMKQEPWAGTHGAPRPSPVTLNGRGNPAASTTAYISFSFEPWSPNFPCPEAGTLMVRPPGQSATSKVPVVFSDVPGGVVRACTSSILEVEPVSRYPVIGTGVEPLTPGVQP